MLLRDKPNFERGSLLRQTVLKFLLWDPLKAWNLSETSESPKELEVVVGTYTESTKHQNKFDIRFLTLMHWYIKTKHQSWKWWVPIIACKWDLPYPNFWRRVLNIWTHTSKSISTFGTFRCMCSWHLKLCFHFSNRQFFPILCWLRRPLFAPGCTAWNPFMILKFCLGFAQKRRT